MDIRIGTWNIAAARKILSLEQFDYDSEEDLCYFAAQIQAAHLDVICIQESHINSRDSQTKRLAKLIDMPYVAETPGCPSHIDSAYNITTAIISRLPFTNILSALLPQPSFELRFKHNGKVVPPYNRYLQTVTIDSSFTIANMHPEPLGAFGLDYEHGVGASLAHDIDLMLTDKLNRPLIFAADFNMQHASAALSNLARQCELREVLPGTPTTPRKQYPDHTDHILTSSEWDLKNSAIVATQSDHYLCWAELELSGSEKD